MRSERKSEIALASGFQPGQVFLPVMVKRYRLELDGDDLERLLDGLATRARPMPDEKHFLIGQRSDQKDTIIENIQSQMEGQP